MARTVNVAVRSVRRDAFIDAAQRLITQKGYERTSVQDVLDDLEVSRGAFYHYFESKERLLEAVIDRMVDDGLASLTRVIDDTGLSALRKFEGVFTSLQSFKAARKDLVLAILQVWISDENAIVREKYRRTAVARLAPMLSKIIEQGNREGEFQAAFTEYTATALVGLMTGFGEVATDLFLARQEKRVSFEEVERAVAANTDACERILGIPTGSLTLIDGPTLHFWFD